MNTSNQSHSVVLYDQTQMRVLKPAGCQPMFDHFNLLRQTRRVRPALFDLLPKEHRPRSSLGLPSSQYSQLHRQCHRSRGGATAEPLPPGGADFPHAAAPQVWRQLGGERWIYTDEARRVGGWKHLESTPSYLKRTRFYRSYL